MQVSRRASQENIDALAINPYCEMGCRDLRAIRRCVLRAERFNANSTQCVRPERATNIGLYAVVDVTDVRERLPGANAECLSSQPGIRFEIYRMTEACRVGKPRPPEAREAVEGRVERASHPGVPMLWAMRIRPGRLACWPCCNAIPKRLSPAEGVWQLGGAECVTQVTKSSFCMADISVLPLVSEGRDTCQRSSRSRRLRMVTTTSI
jgi:hypothetical protein